jgi:uncharacterized protein YbcI
MMPAARDVPTPGYPASSIRTGRDESAWRYEPDRRNQSCDIPVPAHHQEPPALGPLLAEVTNAIVQLHRAHYGKGPTRSKSYLLDDVLICVMRDVFTTVERTLVEAGEHAKVRETRLAFQDAMRDRFTEAVEQIVGRRVLGFTTQVLLEEEVAIEVFVLEPRPSEPAA